MGTRERLADRAIAVSLAGVAGYILYDVRSYPASLVAGSPGPGLFPTLLALLLLLLATLLWVASPSAPRVTETGTDGSASRALVALSVIIVFVATLESTDLFLSLPLLVAATMALMGERRPLVLVLIPLVFDGFVYVVFYRTFGVPFPTIVF